MILKKHKETNNKQTNKQNNNNNNKDKCLTPLLHYNELISYFVCTLFIKQSGTHKIKVKKLQRTHGRYDGDEEYILSKS